MSLARLALRNLKLYCSSSSSSFYPRLSCKPAVSSRIQRQRWSSDFVKRFSTRSTATADDDEEKSNEVAVSENKPKLFQRKQQNRRDLWWRRDHAASPDFFGLGNAVVHASESMGRLLESVSPLRVVTRFREKDDCYKLKYPMPGLSKEDVRVTVEDGVLVVRGERREDDGETSSSDEEEGWWSTANSFYSTAVELPADAKADGIRAEMKGGVLYVMVPKDEGKKKDVKEVPVQ